MKNDDKTFVSSKYFRVNNNWDTTCTKGTAKSAIFYSDDNRDDVWGTLSLAEAQELIEVLQAIIADYPKGPTNEEILNELPNGSIIQFDDEKSRWVKTNSGILLSGDTSMEGDDLSIYEDMKITVKYRGDE